MVSHVQLHNRERNKKQNSINWAKSTSKKSLLLRYILVFFLLFIVLLFLCPPPFIAKDSLRAVRKSSYRHPSILSFSHNLFLYIIILVISFCFFVLGKGVSIVLSSRLFFVFSIIFPFNWVCKLVSSTNKEQQKYQTFLTKQEPQATPVPSF